MRSLIYTALVSLFIFSGCTHLQSVSTTSIPAQRGRKVQADSDKIIFLGFNFSNDYVDSIVKDLAKQCPNGKVEGLLTKQEDVNYFLYIVWKSRVSASGYCTTGTVAANGQPRKPGSENSTQNEDVP